MGPGAHESSGLFRVILAWLPGASLAGRCQPGCQLAVGRMQAGGQGGRCGMVRTFFDV